jgi:hypothetical protein
VMYATNKATKYTEYNIFHLFVNRFSPLRILSFLRALFETK